MIIERCLNATHADTHQHIRFQHRHGGEARFDLSARRGAQGGVENRTADGVINAEALLNGGIGQAELVAHHIAQGLGKNRYQLVLHAAAISGR